MVTVISFNRKASYYDCWANGDCDFFDTKATTITGFMATIFPFNQNILFHLYYGSIKMLRINILEVAIISVNYITFVQ